jgi:hypothetical protein
MATAALAGVATHLPGLFYLVALNAIVAGSEGYVAAVTLVLVFNVIWFGAAFVVVLVFLVRPGAARRTLASVDGWARRHARTVTTVVFALVGCYLTVKGVLDLGS